MFKSIALFLTAWLYPILAASQNACSFLPVDSAPAKEYNLSPSAVVELHLKFIDVIPSVTREQLPLDATPKITIHRYSSEPSIEYDEKSRTVIISADSCIIGDNSAASRRWMASSKWMAVATALIGVADESVRPYASLFAVGGAAVAVVPGAYARKAQQEGIPAVKVTVEAPADMLSSVEHCLDDDSMSAGASTVTLTAGIPSC